MGIESTQTNPIMVSIKMVLGLALIIGLIYIVCLILKRIQESRISAHGRPVMELISTINLGLGPGKSIHLVRVVGRLLVVGATGAGITLLAEIDDDLNLQEVKPETEPQNMGQDARRRFDELLAAYKQKFTGGGQMSGRSEDNKHEM